MATTRNQISYGSQGSDVTELQKLLNQNGYKLDEDGIFGTNTQSAVKDFQKKNKLDEDGIVGTNTWGALTKASTPTTPSESTGNATSTETKSPTFTYGDYKPSDTVAQAEALLNQQLTQKPGQYQSAWQDQLNDVLQQILNREQFSYDLNGDALYQQYKDQYTTQGKMAMMDTMGQAQAMTGGYGNSYAQSVGQQAYQDHLQELNNKIPELYQLAMNKYQMEGDNLQNQAALMAQMEELDYGRYRDQLGDWQSERDYLANRFDTERDYDYGKWADGRDFAYNQFADDRAYDYQVGRDKVTDEQWQKEFDEAKRQFDKQMSLKTGSYGGGSYSGGGGSSSGGSRSSGGSSSSSYDSSTAQIQQMLVNAGYNIAVDGIWGPETQAAYDSYYGNTDGDPVSTPTFDDVVRDMDTAIREAKQNATSQRQLKADVQDHLVNARQAGYITQAEFNRLYKTYAAGGITY